MNHRTLLVTTLAAALIAACGDSTTTPDSDAAGDTSGDSGQDDTGTDGGSDAGSDAPDAAPGCGDGVIDEGEACDDLNAGPGDGCSPDCQIEEGYACDGAPSACATVCGDGIQAGSEACDDNNVVDGDGCSASCVVEIGDGVVVINEVLTADAAEGPDWVEFFNPSDVDVDLSGFTFTDSDPTHIYAFADGTVIEPGAYVRVIQDIAATGAGFDFGLGGADSVTLLDPDGTTIDSIAWVDGDAPTGMSWGRMPNGTGAFETLVNPTPSAQNQPNPPAECGNGTVELGEECDDSNTDDGDGCSSACVIEPGEVVINEVIAAAADGVDRIEFYNTGGEPIDLTGWSFTDNDPTHVFAFVDDTVIAAGAYLVVSRGIELGDFDFGIGSTDEVRLFDASTTEVGRTSWGEGSAPEGGSWARFPDGTGPFGTRLTATPGTPNSEL